MGEDLRLLVLTEDDLGLVKDKENLVLMEEDMALKEEDLGLMEHDHLKLLITLGSFCTDPVLVP